MTITPDYIEHEDLEGPKGKETPNPEEHDVEEVPPIEVVISREVARFNKAEAAIAALRLSYGELTVVDLADKDGYQAVKEAWGKVRSYRTGLEKKGLDIRGDYNKIVKAVSAEENRLLLQIKPLEERLQKEWKRIDELEAAEKKRKLQEEEDKLQARIKRLTDEGMVFDGGYYQLGGTISADVATLRTMRQDKFEELVKAVKAKAAELKASREREEAENRRRKAELEEQENRLKQQREELQQAQDKLRKEQEEAEKNRLELRILQFQARGLRRDNNFLVYDNGFDRYSIGVLLIKDATEERLAELLEKTEASVREFEVNKAAHQEKARKDAEAVAAKEKLAHALLTGAGMTFDLNANTFIFHNGKLALSYYTVNLMKKNEEELRELAIEVGSKIAQAKREQAAEEEKQRRIKEQERQDAMSDAERMRGYMVKLMAVELPEMKSAEYREKLEAFGTKFHKLYATYLPLTEGAKA